MTFNWSASSAIDPISSFESSCKFTRKVDPERQGKEAAEEVMNKQLSKPQSMFREDVGEITFDLGDKNAGLAHVIRQRVRKDKMSEDEAIDFVQNRIPAIIANGKLKGFADSPQGRRAILEDKTGRLVLALNRHGERETWLITGFEKFRK